MKGYDYSRYNFRYKSNYKPFKWLTIKPSISGAMRDVTDAQYSVTAMYSMLPWDSPYDENGNLVPHYYSGWVNNTPTNYLLDLSYGNHTDYKTYEFLGNVDFDIKITDWLTFHSVNSYKYQNYYYHSYTDPRSSGASGVNGRIDEYQSNMVRRYTNQYLSFSKQFNKHSIEAVLAYEFKDYQSKVVQAKGTGFAPGFEVLDVVALPEATKGSLSESAIQSYFVRANYSYDNKYVAEVSIRRDGASNFGDNARYGNFYSISGGWNIHRENWFKADWVDILKVRASYGTMGNRPGVLYPQYALYSVSANYNGVPATLINQVGNPDLTWEQTSTFGIGLDANLFSNRLRISLDYYNKYTTDVLYKTPVSGLTGVTSRWQNVGEISNKGIELTIGGNIIQTKDWNWDLSFNMTWQKMKVKNLSLTAGTPATNTSVGPYIDSYQVQTLSEGYAPYMFYVYHQLYDEKTGKPVEGAYVDLDGDGQINSNDLYRYHSPAPDYILGFSTSLRYKKWTLSTSLRANIGNYVYNAMAMNSGAWETVSYNSYQLNNLSSTYLKTGFQTRQYLSDYYVENASFLKMDNLSLGYNFGTIYKGCSLNVSAMVQNVFCITKYSGVDPEIPNGVDNSFYPRPRTFSLNIGINF